MSEICQEVQELLPGYSIEALEPGEAAYVRRHLADCPGCDQELRNYQRLAEALLHMPPRQSPPTELRARIAAAALAPPPARTDARRRLAPTAMWVGLALLLLLNVGLLWRLGEVGQQQAALRAQVERVQTGLALGTYPTSQVAGLAGEGVFGTVVYDPGRSLALVYAWGLEPLPAGRAYQLWLREAGEGRVSGAIFQPDEDGAFTVVVVRSPQPIGDFVGIGATVEPAGGSPGPTGPPVFTADF